MLAIVYICLMLIPATVVCDPIDAEILKAATGVHDLDFFHATSDGKLDVKTELDIKMRLNLFKDMNWPAESGKEKRAIRDVQFRWTNGVVFYEILGGEPLKGTVEAAINEFMKYTCLKFIASTKAFNRIVIYSGNGCWSYVGMVGNRQRLSLGPGCQTLPIALHQIGHAIGFFHEHSRPDRDTYIRPLSLSKINATFFNTYNIPYDYKSIMHYSHAQTLDPKYQDVIGNVNSLSYADIKRANSMYLCDITQGCPDQECPPNGFILSQPYKNEPKCRCWCESPFDDDPLMLCEEVHTGLEGPNLELADTLASISIPECSDLRENCLILKQKGVCLFELKMMMNLCPKTCDYCDKLNDFCIDSEDSCGVLANSGACEDVALNETMSKLCPKSCGLCSEIATTCDIERAFTIL